MERRLQLNYKCWEKELPPNDEPDTKEDS